MERERNNPLSHAAIYLVARGLPGVVAFLSIPLFSRLLNPADYGRYALVMATATLLNALLFQWLRLSLVRYLPAYEEDSGRLKSTLVAMTCILVLALGAVALGVCLLPVGAAWRAVAASCWMMVALQALFELCCEYARASIRPWQYMGMQLARSIAVVTIGVGLVMLGMRWWGPLAGAAAGMAVAVVYCARRDWVGIGWRIDRDVLAKVWRYGAPLSLTVALAVVISSSDRFLLAWFMGEGVAGLYSVAVDFTSQTLTLLLVVVHMAMFPLAVRAWERKGLAAAQEQMVSNASLLLAIGVPCVIGLWILAPGISFCFLGKSFRAAAAGIMPLIALGTFLGGFKAYHFDAAFQFAHRTMFQVWIVLSAAVVNIALNLALIPRMGLQGAVLASLIAYAISIVLTAWLGRRHFALPFPWRACATVLIAGMAMGFLLYPFRRHISAPAVGIQVGGGALAYIVVLIACNFLQLRGKLADRFVSRRSEGRSASADAPPMGSPSLVETR